MVTLPDSLAPDADHGTDKLVGLVRDPGMIFLYWRTCPAHIAAFLQPLAAVMAKPPQWVLRLRSRNRHARSEVAVDVNAASWYASVLPDDTYTVSLGVLDRTGGFHAFLDSAELHTPPLSYSHLYDPQWKVLEDDYEQLLSLGWAGEPVGSSMGSGFMPDDDTASAAPTATDESSPTSPGTPTYQNQRRQDDG